MNSSLMGKTDLEPRFYDEDKNNNKSKTRSVD